MEPAADLTPTVPCPHCEGEGVVEKLTAHRCTVPISRCCGGCSELDGCPMCGGSGRVEALHCSRCTLGFPEPLAVKGEEIAEDLAYMLFCPGCAAELAGAEEVAA